MSLSLPIFETPDDAAPVTPPPAPDAARQAGRLHDSQGRVIHDLRISVTDRCNYRCVYCMDPDYRYMPKTQLMDVDEYLAVARNCAALGITKVRITGGEPTLYADLDKLLAGLRDLKLHDIAMTTNGSTMTSDKARRWRELGLKRITLSMDSIRPERHASITRAKAGPDVIIDAIEIARAAGFGPIKVNAVMMRGVNDDEAADLADFARTHAIDMRFIEFMPLDSGHHWIRDNVVSADEIIAQISARHELVSLDRDHDHSTSLNFAFADGGSGRVGVIAPVTRAFCGACSRIRLTAEGRVRPCLFSDTEWDLKPLLRSGAPDQDVQRFIIDAMWTKQAGHGIGTDDFVQPQRGMSAIGG